MTTMASGNLALIKPNDDDDDDDDDDGNDDTYGSWYNTIRIIGLFSIVGL